MELETWNFVYMKFKTIQFDTLVETDLKGMITSINLTFFICVNLMESSKFDENFVKKLFFLVKSNWIRHELYILSLNLTLGISFSHINTWIVSFYPKNLFLSKFSSNFELFFRFTQITKVRFIDVIIPLRSISTNVSNCIVLNFMYTKFQVSSSKKWQSYWYSNMVHLLLITLYIKHYIISQGLMIESWLWIPFQ